MYSECASMHTIDANLTLTDFACVYVCLCVHSINLYFIIPIYFTSV